MAVTAVVGSDGIVKSVHRSGEGIPVELDEGDEVMGVPSHDDVHVGQAWADVRGAATGEPESVLHADDALTDEEAAERREAKRRLANANDDGTIDPDPSERPPVAPPSPPILNQENRRSIEDATPADDDEIDGMSREELYHEAQERDIPGRSSMSVEELREAVRTARAEDGS